MIYKGVTLDPFQEQAVRIINDRESLIVAAPTGAGKTLVAEYAIEKCMAEGARVLYTAPIKALSNQKFRDFSQIYGDRVGIKTGDVTLNPDGQVILMTTEIFRNTIFESPEAFHDVRYVIFDEIHYLDDIERGTVWEESIIFAPEHIRVLCLSATVPNLEPLSKWIQTIRPTPPLHVIIEQNRPVPLKHQLFVPGLGLKNLGELRKYEQGDIRQYYQRIDPNANPNRWRSWMIDHLAEAKRLPVLWFAFNRRECEQFASLVQRPLLVPEERHHILELFDDLLRKFDLVPDATTEHLRKLLEKGVSYHHAGLLPTLKEVIERIFTSGLIKLLFATETFAVGVNMPARTVVFNSIFKFDGKRLGPIKTREHHQMSGRAGRRGIDEVGYVYSVVEWPHMRVADIERVIEGEIEPIRSQFNLSYATLLTLWEHLGNKIYTAAEKSFANFDPRRRGEKLFQSKVAQIRKRLSLLKAMGYIRDGKLTAKGQFARQIQGYELQITELLFRGFLKQLAEEELAVLFHAVVYEAKKADWARKYDHGRFKWLKKAAYAIVDDIGRAEERAELEDRTKSLEFKLAGVMNAWAKGCTWAELESHTSASDGDMVRFFRLALQLLKNTMYALPKEDPLRDKLRGAAHRINRDVVDAERQLRLGTPEVHPPADPVPEPVEDAPPATLPPGPPEEGGGFPG
ncbi:MAG TPA: DEAD/DEAH box helicase [Planctomycetota bacterium]|nr:DEAD/DEAH box helicase [Planctomycetota bacterium]